MLDTDMQPALIYCTFYSLGFRHQTENISPWAFILFDDKSRALSTTSFEAARVDGSKDVR
jgi:hypothetical protein